MSRWCDVTSGWVLSAGIHLILLLGAGLICLEQFVQFDDDPGLRIGIRSLLRLEGEGFTSKVPDRSRYGRLPMPGPPGENSGLFEENGSSLVSISKDYELCPHDSGGTSCDYCAPRPWCGFSRMRDLADLLDRRPRPPSAPSKVESEWGCRYRGPLPLTSRDVALVSFLAGMNALPLGLASVR